MLSCRMLNFKNVVSLDPPLIVIVIVLANVSIISRHIILYHSMSKHNTLILSNTYKLSHPAGVDNIDNNTILLLLLLLFFFSSPSSIYHTFSLSLYYIILYYIILYYIISYITLYYIILYYITSYYTPLQYLL